MLPTCTWDWGIKNKRTPNQGTIVRDLKQKILLREQISFASSVHGKTWKPRAINSEGPKAPSRFMEQREVTINNIYWGAVGGRNQQSTTQPPLSSSSPSLNIRGYCVCVCVCVWSLWCVWFFANPMDCSPPGSSVHGISQVRILEWVVISYSRGSSWLRDQTHVSCVSCTRLLMNG